MKFYKTYKITCLSSGKIYFGQTSCELLDRLKRHSKERRNTIVSRSIKKHGISNHPITLIKNHKSLSEALLHEVYLINRFKTNVCKYPTGLGMNLTDGGEGTVGHKFSEEQKQEMKKLGKGWYSKSRRTKAVYKFSETGELLNAYKSTVEATRENGAATGEISRCCNGKIRSVKGFIYSYDQKGPLPTYKTPLRKSVKLTNSNNEVFVFKSRKEAASFCKVSHPDILTNHIKSSKQINGYLVSWA